MQTKLDLYAQSINAYENAQRIKAIAEQKRAQAQYEAEQRTSRLIASADEIVKNNSNPLLRGLATALDIPISIIEGVDKSLEGVVDLAATGVGAVGGIFSSDFQDAVKDFVATDLVEERSSFYHYDELQKYSYLNDGDVGSIVRGIASGVGQMLPTVLVAIATGGASAAAQGASTAAQAASTAAQTASLAYMGASAAGNATEEAFQDGAEYYPGLGYGVASGLVEVGTEKLFGGVNKALTGAGLIRNSVADIGVKRVLKNIAEEGAEEMISEAASPALKTIYKGPDALSEYSSPDFKKNLLVAGAVGSGTAGVYGGTVGRALTKIGYGYTGKEADIADSLQEALALQKKAANLQTSDRLTEKQLISIDTDILKNYENVEKVLSSVSKSRRSELLKKFDLEGDFDADGKLSASLRARFDVNDRSGKGFYSSDAPLPRSSYSHNLYGHEDVIRDDLKQLTEARAKAFRAEREKSGESVTMDQARQAVGDFSVFSGELTEKGKSARKSFMQFINALNRASGDNISFVAVAPNNEFRAANIGNRIYISTDVFENGSWAESEVHEYTHISEGSPEYASLARLLNSDDFTVDDENGGKISLRQKALDAVMSKDYGFTAEQIDTLANKPSSELTEKERLAVNTFFSELVAHESAMLFGNVDFVSRVILRDASFAKKFFAKIADLKKAFSRISDPAAKAEYKRLRAAESVWLSAAKSARSAYFIRYMVSRDDELKEEAEKIDKEPQFNLKERDNSENSSENPPNKRFALEGAGAKKTPVTNTETDSMHVTGDNDEDNETLEWDDGNRLALTESATPKITAETSESDRYEMLKGRSISLSAKTDTERLAEVKGKFNISDQDIEFSEYGDRKRLLRKIADEFGVFRKYKNTDVLLDFGFSIGNFKHSISSQRKNYTKFVKMLSCIDEVINNAVGIEVHKYDNYKPDPTLDNLYVLTSAFVDGDAIIPVKLEIKQFSDKENTLYVAVALESIKIDEVNTQGNTEIGVTKQYAHSSTISIAELFRKVNPSDESFVKYIPDGFLNEVQLEAKRKALEVDERKGKTSKKTSDGKRFALDVDSEGTQLTESQQEFFKDSKVRDSEGKLLVVYHGTPDGKFYEFSYDKAGMVGGSQHGYGFYFSDSERDAKLYTQGTGTIIRAHLNITNPIDATAKDLSSDVSAIFDRLPMYAKSNLREKYGDLETAKRQFAKWDNGTMLSILCRDTEMHPEVFNTVLLNLGYDGIVYAENGYATEYVAFKSSQAKATTNKTPTSNPDIRFDLVEKKNSEISVTDDEYNFTVNKERNTPPDDPYYEDFLLQEIAVRQAENVELKDKNEKVNSVAKLADKFKEMSFGAFQNATQFHPDILQKIQREMAKIEWRGNINKASARKHIGELYRWYSSNREALGDRYIAEMANIMQSLAPFTSTLSAEDQSRIDSVTNAFLKAGNSFSCKPDDLLGMYRILNSFYTKNGLRKLNEARKVDGLEPLNLIYDDETKRLLSFLSSNDEFNLYELDMLDKVLKYVMRFVSDYNTVLRDGKRVDAIPVAKDYISIFEEKKKINEGVFRNLFTKYLYAFADPMAFARFIDGYNENGFFTHTISELRKGETNASIMENRFHEPIEDFYSDFHKRTHKNFISSCEEHSVSYLGYQIPASKAMALYCTLKRDHAVPGLALSGFKYLDEKDTTFRIEGFSDQKASLSDMMNDAKHQLSLLKEQFTDDELAFIKIVEKLMNNDLREAKRLADIERQGYSNVTNGYYFPIHRDNISKDMEDITVFSKEITSVNNASFNKNTVKGAKGELFLSDIFTVTNRHIRGISLYSNLSSCIDEFNMIFNLDVSGNPNKPVSVRTASDDHWKDGANYILKLLEDIKGVERAKISKDFGEKLTSKVRSGYAISVLALNPKVLATQLSSIFASASILDFDCVFKGFFGRGSDVDKYCPLAKVRNSENTVALAKGVLDKTQRLGSFLMKPIGMMDRLVVTKLFRACQLQVQKNEGLALGSEENKIRAGELLTNVILETQQNATATNRSAAMRSPSEFLKSVVMFTSDAMKVVGRVIDATGSYATLFRARNQMKNSGGDAARLASLESDLKHAGTKLKKSVFALLSSAVYMSLIGLLFSKIIYKKDDEEEEPAALAKEFSADVFGNMIGGLPFLSDSYEAILKGYDISSSSYSVINDLAGSFNTLARTVFSDKSSPQDYASCIRTLFLSAGKLFGIPVSNVERIFNSAIYRISPSAAYAKDSIFYEKSYSSDLAKAIENGDDSMISTISALMLNQNFGSVKNESVRIELDRLIRSGLDVLPRSIGDSIAYDGEVISLTKRQRERFESVYFRASDELASLISSELYRSADEDTRAKSIRYVYSLYYNLALEDLLGIELETKNSLFSKAVPVYKLAIILSTASSLSADLDKNGSPIAGSKKNKLIAFLESLKLSAAQKHILLGYFGYKNSLGQSQVRSFIQSLPLTKSEKENLFAMSGY